MCPIFITGVKRWKAFVRSKKTPCEKNPLAHFLVSKAMKVQNKVKTTKISNKHDFSELLLVWLISFDFKLPQLHFLLVFQAKQILRWINHSKLQITHPIQKIMDRIIFYRFNHLQRRNGQHRFRAIGGIQYQTNRQILLTVHHEFFRSCKSSPIKFDLHKANTTTYVNICSLGGCNGWGRHKWSLRDRWDSFLAGVGINGSTRRCSRNTGCFLCVFRGRILLSHSWHP